MFAFREGKNLIKQMVFNIFTVRKAKNLIKQMVSTFSSLRDMFA